MSDMPEVIYLTQDCAEDEDSYLWCQDRVLEDDIEYTLTSKANADKESLKAELIEVVEAVIKDKQSTIENTFDKQKINNAYCDALHDMKQAIAAVLEKE